LKTHLKTQYTDEEQSVVSVCLTHKHYLH
jgi:hypothetical protein